MFEEYGDQVVEEPFETWAELEANYRFAAECSPELLKKPFGEVSETRRRMQRAAESTTGEDVLIRLARGGRRSGLTSPSA
jgi:hypothetical protein